MSLPSPCLAWEASNPDSLLEAFLFFVIVVQLVEVFPKLRNYLERTEFPSTRQQLLGS